MSGDRVTSWPSAVEYSDAVQDPERTMVDVGLRRAEFRVNSMGMPAVRTGQLAAVFPARIDARSIAVRFFTSPADHRDRYEALGRYLADRDLPALVRSRWLDQAVSIGDETYPAAVMPWIEGRSLTAVVDDAIDDGDVAVLVDAADRWRKTVAAMNSHSVVHGDFQHGNVMIQGDGAIRLVDYDGIWVPGMDGMPLEVGHPNYQHPQRAEHTDVCTGADSVPALVIYLSLRALAVDPDLWDDLHNGENLIFTAEDLRDGARHGSPVWTRLAQSTDPEVVEMAETLAKACGTRLEDVPDMEALISGGVSGLDSGRRYVAERAGRAGPGGWWGESPASGPVVPPTSAVSDALVGGAGPPAAAPISAVPAAVPAEVPAAIQPAAAASVPGSVTGPTHAEIRRPDPVRKVAIALLAVAVAIAFAALLLAILG